MPQLDIRKDFPIFSRENHEAFVYLDSAASSQKPKKVIDALTEFYSEDYGTVRRGVYKLSEKANASCIKSRELVARLLGNHNEKEIIFTSGTTAAINLVAQTWGRYRIPKGKDIILSEIEHHANIVPWQIIAKEKELNIKVIPVNDNGELILEKYEELLSENTAFVSVGYISNALGTIHPVKRIIELAHSKGAKVMIDAAQACGHVKVDVKDLDCDFLAFSGHKILGPTGIGVLYGKSELLEDMPPYQSGGDMIDKVSFDGTTYAGIPHRFEAGTPNIAGIIGIGAAIEYILDVGLEKIESHEKQLLEYATNKLKELDGLKIIGTAKEKSGILSFWLDSAHPQDIGTILDHDGIAVRAGHHCSQTTMKRFNVPATTRASFGPYNNFNDIDQLYISLKKIIEMFS